MNFDGDFKYENSTIYYNIEDDKNPIRVNYKGVEKMGRFIHYFNEKFESIGVKHVYGEVEKMTNIFYTDVAEWYEEYISSR